MNFDTTRIMILIIVGTITLMVLMWKNRDVFRNSPLVKLFIGEDEAQKSLAESFERAKRSEGGES